MSGFAGRQAFHASSAAVKRLVRGLPETAGRRDVRRDEVAKPGKTSPQLSRRARGALLSTTVEPRDSPAAPEPGVVHRIKTTLNYFRTDYTGPRVGSFVGLSSVRPLHAAGKRGLRLRASSRKREVTPGDSAQGRGSPQPRPVVGRPRSGSARARFPCTSGCLSGNVGAGRRRGKAAASARDARALAKVLPPFLRTRGSRRAN